MNTSAIEIAVPVAETVAVTEDTLTVELSDGRSLSVPLAWFPQASPCHSCGTQELAINRARARHPLEQARRGHQR